MHLEFVQIEKFLLTVGVRARFGRFQTVQRTMFREQFLVGERFGAECALEMEFLGVGVSIVVSLIRTAILHLFVTNQTGVHGHFIIRFPSGAQRK